MRLWAWPEQLVDIRYSTACYHLRRRRRRRLIVEPGQGFGCETLCSF